MVLTGVGRTMRTGKADACHISQSKWPNFPQGWAIFASTSLICSAGHKLFSAYRTLDSLKLDTRAGEINLLFRCSCSSRGSLPAHTRRSSLPHSVPPSHRGKSLASPQGLRSVAFLFEHRQPCPGQANPQLALWDRASGLSLAPQSALDVELWLGSMLTTATVFTG